MDGTFLKGRYGGVLLVATAQDANRHVYPIAFAVVDAETESSWDFFLKNLRIVVPDCDEQVFVSDRNPSIKTGIWTNYPLSKHGICIYHLKQNVKKRCRVQQIQDLFVMAAESYRKTDCINIFGQIYRV